MQDSNVRRVETLLNNKRLKTGAIKRCMQDSNVRRVETLLNYKWLKPGAIKDACKTRKSGGLKPS
jgi:hypothetical protein